MKNKLFGIVVLLLGCAAAEDMAQDMVNNEPPKQASRDNSALSRKGAAGFEQRQRDCWDVPNAEACYEVGMSYELGLRGPRDAKTAREYYQKACDLEKNPEHCEAAKRTTR